LDVEQPQEANMTGVRKKTIVVIEDETEMVDLIRLILEKRGLQVVGAASGRDGLYTIPCNV
jgi:CheY-like chemotaxis protein